MERKAPADALTLAKWQRLLDDEVFPRLKNPVAGKAENGTRNYRALAPCHDDRARSLVVSVGDWKPVVWICHACREVHGDDEMKRMVRRELIKAGVPTRLLTLTGAAQVDVAETLFALCAAGVKAEAFRLAAVAIAEGYDRAPHGDELVDLGRRHGITRSTAFRVRKELPEDHLYIVEVKEPCQAPQVRRAS